MRYFMPIQLALILVILVVSVGCGNHLEVSDAPNLRGAKGVEVQSSSLSEASSASRQLLAASVQRLLGSPQRVYLHDNHLGSVTLASNSEGRVVGQRKFGPYGKLIEETGLVDTYGFSGQELDASTGLLHFKSRYLDTQAARWSSLDPAFAFLTGNLIFRHGEASNGYAYVANGAINNFDPSGLGLKSAVKKAGAKLKKKGGKLVNRMVGGVKKGLKDVRQKQHLGSKTNMAMGLVGGALGIGAIVATGGAAAAGFGIAAGVMWAASAVSKAKTGYDTDKNKGTKKAKFIWGASAAIGVIAAATGLGGIALASNVLWGVGASLDAAYSLNYSLKGRNSSKDILVSLGVGALSIAGAVTGILPNGADASAASGMGAEGADAFGAISSHVAGRITGRVRRR